MPNIPLRVKERTVSSLCFPTFIVFPLSLFRRLQWLHKSAGSRQASSLLKQFGNAGFGSMWRTIPILTHLPGNIVHAPSHPIWLRQSSSFTLSFVVSFSHMCVWVIISLPCLLSDDAENVWIFYVIFELSYLLKLLLLTFTINRKDCTVKEQSLKII